MGAPSEMRPGAVLGRYECLIPIARGGMAAVWAGRLRGARGFEQIVALKTISAALVDDPTFVAMFLEEANLASRIRHPNVVAALDLGEEGELLYLVMEWVNGEPLSMLLREALQREEVFPLPVIGRIALDVCAGLQAAHELRGDDGASLGVVHRDVSPQNVMVSVDGLSKLVDFGVAKATLRACPETAPGMAKGKISYMAPEQAMGLALDRRADLFPVGVMLFQMLTSRHPFRGENDVVTLGNLLSGGFPAPSGAAGRPLPAALDRVVLRAMAREPGERFSSATELGEALGEALQGEVASAGEVARFVREIVGERIVERQRGLRIAIADADNAAERASRPSRPPRSSPSSRRPGGRGFSEIPPAPLSLTPPDLSLLLPARLPSFASPDLTSPGVADASLGPAEPGSPVTLPPGPPDARRRRGSAALVAAGALLGVAALSAVRGFSRGGDAAPASAPLVALPLASVSEVPASASAPRIEVAPAVRKVLPAATPSRSLPAASAPGKKGKPPEKKQAPRPPGKAPAASPRRSPG